MNDWFDHILFYTRSQPETPAVAMEDRVVTYGMLRAAIETCAQRILALGIDGESVVALCLANPVRHLTLSLALFRIGTRSVSLDLAHHGVIDVKTAVFLGDAEAKRVFAASTNFVDVTDDWFAPGQTTTKNLPAPFSGEQQICRLSPTSGSTGEPKLVPTTVGYIARDMISGMTSFNCERVLSLPGLTSVFGFKLACGALASGKTLFFAASPFQVVRMIELFAIEYVICSTDQLVSLVRVARSSNTHLKSLRTVAAGGGIPTRALLEAATIYLCKDIRSRYGSSEVGLMGLATAREILSKPGFVGYVQPAFEIAVFDEQGRPCQPNEVGLIRGRAKQHGKDAEWIDQGDVGWLTSGGELFVVGRVSDIPPADFANASTRQISPVHEVEHLVRLEWDASDAAAVLVRDGEAGMKPQIWVATVDCKGARADTLEAILRRKGIEASIRLFPVSSIPRGASGKIQRAQLKALMLTRPGAA